MRVYLDNCCYNRPYDDQSQIRVFLEAHAKMYIQYLIKTGVLELVSSYTLTYEISRNPSEIIKESILSFINENTSFFVDASMSDKVSTLAEIIMKTGIKRADAHHVASAIIANCEYLITTDDRLLKYQSERIRIVSPTEFIRIIGGADNV